MLSIISVAVMSQTYNLNISGTVTDEISGEPVIQHFVDIFIPGDSVTGDFFYFNRVFTDGNGHYEDNIDVPTGETGDVYVETFSCDNYLSETQEYGENNNVLVFDFSICNDPAGNECQAFFDYHSEGGPLSIVFTDLSLGNPETWLWNFGDGTTSTQQYPVHIYGEEGEYYVSLEIATDSGDCSSIFEMPIWVGNDSIWPGDCMAMYYYYADSVDYLTVDFIDMSMGREGLDPDSWFWEFGDGTSSVEQNPSHTYGDFGEYDVCLTIQSTDPVTGETCESTFCSLVYVTDWGNYCEAWFYYMPQGDTNNPNGDLGMTIQFIDESWGNPTSWSWDFGDGFTSGEQNPVHEYAEDGIYDVCLSIFSDSCESTYCEEVFVYGYSWDECYTWFDYNVTDLTVDYTAYYQGADSSAVSVTYSWEFGDGETAYGETVQHVYAEEGYYEVLLVAIADDGSCETEWFDYVWVGDEFSFGLEGYVYLDDSVMADFADVYLMTFDTLGNELINITTTQIDSYGYYEFEEDGFENCMYFIQAELTEASGFYGDYAPTYHYSALNWEEAWPVFPFPMGYTFDVHMISNGDVTQGSGFINGIVNADESRGIMSNVLVMLQDIDGKTLTYVRTNENGEFQFSNLSYGTYIVYTEIVGIETTPAVVNLTQDNSTVDITIIVANGEAVMGIDNISAFVEEVGNISPNPVLENAYFEITLKQDSEIIVYVINQFGQTIETNATRLNAGKNEVHLQTSSLPQGVYIVNILAEDGIGTVRKFVKIR